MMLICHIKVITVENEKKKSIDRSRSIVRSFSQPVVLFGSFIQIIRSRFKKKNLFHSIPFFILKSKFKLKVHLWKQKKELFFCASPVDEGESLFFWYLGGHIHTIAIVILTLNLNGLNLKAIHPSIHSYIYYGAIVNQSNNQPAHLLMMMMVMFFYFFFIFE